MDYFKNAFPNAFAWRFHRKKIKCALITGNIGGAIIRNLFDVYKMVKVKKPDFEIDPCQIMNYYFEERQKILNI